MRKDRRNAKVRFHMPEGASYLHYKGEKCELSIGKDDNVEIFRYGDDFFLLEFNPRLNYLGFELISKNMELIQDMFIQYPDDFSEAEGLKKHILDYSTPFQADILSKWIQ
jgi:hypothetical protein